MDEIKKTKGKQIKEPRTKTGGGLEGLGGKGAVRGWRAKNSFPIKLYPFALIYRFHALSPLSTAELSGEKRAASRNAILKFSISHFPSYYFP